MIFKKPIQFICVLSVSLLLSFNLFSADDPEKVEEVPTLSLDELDRELVIKRIEKSHMNFRFKLKPSWKVSFDGTTQNWMWNGSGWDCSQAKTNDINDGSEMIEAPSFNCEDWVPLSFQWWVLSRSWLLTSYPDRKSVFKLWRPQADRAMAGDGQIFPFADLVEEVEREESKDLKDQLTIFDGKRRASEVWEWRLHDGKLARIYISLRNQWIERIERGDWTEYIEWQQKNKWRAPEIKRVVVEANGKRFSFSSIDQ